MPRSVDAFVRELSEANASCLGSLTTATITFIVLAATTIAAALVTLGFVGGVFFLRRAVREAERQSWDGRPDVEVQVGSPRAASIVSSFASPARSPPPQRADVAPASSGAVLASRWQATRAVAAWASVAPHEKHDATRSPPTGHRCTRTSLEEVRAAPLSSAARAEPPATPAPHSSQPFKERRQGDGEGDEATEQPTHRQSRHRHRHSRVQKPDSREEAASRSHRSKSRRRERQGGDGVVDGGAPQTATPPAARRTAERSNGAADAAAAGLSALDLLAERSRRQS